MAGFQQGAQKFDCFHPASSWECKSYISRPVIVRVSNRLELFYVIQQFGWIVHHLKSKIKYIFDVGSGGLSMIHKANHELNHHVSQLSGNYGCKCIIIFQEMEGWSRLSIDQLNLQW